MALKANNNRLLCATIVCIGGALSMPACAQRCDPAKNASADAWRVSQCLYPFTFVPLVLSNWAIDHDRCCRTMHALNAETRRFTLPSPDLLRYSGFAPGEAVASVPIPGDVPFVSYPGEPVRYDYCSGQMGCQTECCKRADCIGWRLNGGGTAHAACGGNSCEIFVTNASSSEWAGIKQRAPTLPPGGIDYLRSGNIFNGTEQKAACCGGGCCLRINATADEFYDQLILDFSGITGCTFPITLLVANATDPSNPGISISPLGVSITGTGGYSFAPFRPVQYAPFDISGNGTAFAYIVDNSSAHYSSNRAFFQVTDGGQLTLA